MEPLGREHTRQRVINVALVPITKEELDKLRGTDHYCGARQRYLAWLKESRLQDKKNILKIDRMKPGAKKIMRDADKRYREKNKEKIRLYNKRYRKEHIEKIKKYQREYYRNHKEKLLFNKKISYEMKKNDSI